MAYEQHFRFALRRLVAMSLHSWLQNLDQRLATTEFDGESTAGHDWSALRQVLQTSLVALALAGEEGPRKASLLCVELESRIRRHGFAVAQRLELDVKVLMRASQAVVAAKMLAAAAPSGVLDAAVRVDPVQRQEWVMEASEHFKALLSAEEQPLLLARNTETEVSAALRAIDTYMSATNFSATINLQNNLLRCVLRHAEVLLSGLKEFADSSTELANQVASGEVDPVGLSVSRRPGAMPSPLHVAPTGDRKWSLVSTGSLMPSREARGSCSAGLPGCQFAASEHRRGLCGARGARVCGERDEQRDQRNLAARPDPPAARRRRLARARAADGRLPAQPRPRQDASNCEYADSCVSQ